ncbi:MAG: hypothetical protein K8S55_12195 [Phycisphaerae bacterium]|nr:hypothetical protein [Phycisphaerae bacterium]
MGRSRIIQIACLLLAAGLLTTAGLLQKPILQESEKSDFLSRQNLAAMERSPQLAVLTSVPGGLRVLAVNYLWIRSQTLHQEGRHFDAYQLAELICQLQPYQPGVWAFQAWNMAWNISVTTQTREERWRWVYNGVKLLRDRAIVQNPRSMLLYKELSWIFFSKMGGYMDDMHWSYKQRWAGMMQSLLGSPPSGDDLKQTLAQETDLAIEAFGAIANAPLDTDPVRWARERIQQDKRQELLADPVVSAYAEKLKAFGVDIDESLLGAYNRFSLDDSVQAVRIIPPQLKSQREKELSALINDNAAAAKQAREKMLAFVRAQILWNEYHLDPQFMWELMKRYKVPLDWRHTMSHGLYWAAYGLKVCDPSETDFLKLNHRRNVLNSLKNLTSMGLVNILWRPDNPDYPNYYESADLRYIEPTHQQHIEYAKADAKLKGKTFDKNTLASGHVNYLIKAMDLLVADGRIGGIKPKVGTAQYYYDYIKREYKRTGKMWDSESVEDFVVAEMAAEGSVPRYEITLVMLKFTLKRALVARGLTNDEKEFQNRWRFARRLFNAYQKGAADRMKIPGGFNNVAGNVLTVLLGRPRTLGLTISVADRSDIYLALADKPQIQVIAYHQLEGFLRRLCKAGGIDFAKAFPAPPGLEGYRRKLRQVMPAANPGRDKTK